MCRTVEPLLHEAVPGHQVVCHFPENTAPSDSNQLI